MKQNTIVIGSNGSGKTRRFLIPEILWCSGNAIAFALDVPPIDKSIKIENAKLIYTIDDLPSDSKMLHRLIDFRGSEPVFIAISSLVKTIQTHHDKINKPLLIAFDNISKRIFDMKMDNGSTLFLNLLGLSNLNSNIRTFFTFNSSEFIAQHQIDVLDVADVINIQPLQFNPDEAELRKYTGELRVRFPKSLHKELVRQAELEGVSLNQYIIYLLAKSIV